MIENATTVGDDGTVRLETVVYSAHMWTTFTTGMKARSETLAEYAEHYRTGVTAIYKNLGHDQLGGRDTLHLQRHASFDTPMGTRAFTNDLWVDALTYLPVRQRNSTSGTGGQMSVTDYDWLPRTPENLLKLELVVPDGFKHTKGATNGTFSSGSTSLSFGTTLFQTAHS
jgi:hypothetical protein